MFEGGLMKSTGLGYALCILTVVVACSSSKPMVVQSFSPIPIDISRVQNGDYAEVEQIVNAKVADGQPTYGETSLAKEEATYLYLRLFSRVKEGQCYRVTIDKRRSAIVNMQPDCPIEEE